MIDSPWNLMHGRTTGLGQLNASSSKQQVEQAVAGFESVLVREWLRQVRSSPLLSESSMGGGGYLQMADDQLAALVSRGKGLGLGKQLADQLLKQIQDSELIANGNQAVKPSGMMEVSSG